MKSIADLQADVQTHVSADDIVKAIICKSGRATIPKSEAFLQRAFYRMKQEHPDLLSAFVFDESGVSPFSDELDSVLFRLEMSDILSTLNPAYKDYTTAYSSEPMLKSCDKLKHKTSEIERCASVLAAMAGSIV